MADYWRRLDPDHVSGAGAESFNAMTGRVAGSLERLRKMPQDFVAVFTHNRILITILTMLDNPGLSGGNLMAAVGDRRLLGAVPNGAIIQVTADQNGMKLDGVCSKAGEGALRSLLPTQSGPESLRSKILP